MVLLVTRLALVLAVGDLAIALSNSSLLEVANDLVTPAPTAPTGGARRAAEPTKKKKKHTRSTSSDSNDKKEEDTGTKDSDSLNLSDDKSDDDVGSAKKESNNKYIPKSTEERKGWKKWHRKCTPCREDIKTKWREPTINWICGAYQTARRSFKSACSMRLRNCQDGTMFVKIHDHRCKDDPAHGTHFFYDYKVRISPESGTTTSELDSSVDETGSHGSEARRRSRRAGGKSKDMVLNSTIVNITVSSGTVVSSNTTTRQTYPKRSNMDQHNL